MKIQALLVEISGISLQSMDFFRLIDASSNSLNEMLIMKGFFSSLITTAY